LWRSINSSFHAPPLLEPLFAQDGRRHGVMQLSEDKPVDTIPRSAEVRITLPA
jgi:hypothetical protein